jgi:replicative DNA helicase
MTEQVGLLQRVPPQNLEAERAVLGSLLLVNEHIGQVIDSLSVDEFYARSHRVIYRAILDLYNRGEAVDFLTLRDELRRKDELETAGGLAYLSGLTDVVPAAANVQHYTRIVRETAALRSLIQASTDILSSAYGETERADQLLDQAESRIFEIAERRLTSDLIPLKDVVKRAMEHIESIHERGSRITGLATGFYELDELTAGLQPAEFIVLAARPAIGKTTFALNVAERVAVTDGKAVALFSLEMSTQQLAQNLLCLHRRLDAQKVRKGMLDQEERSELRLAAEVLYQAPVYLNDSPSLSVLGLRAKARRLKRQHDIQLVIVDYLQLMEPPPAESRQQQVAEISRSLKGLARELGVPVLAVSQLNRAPEAREDHRPRLADLRESGAIEQDADVVLLLHRDDAYDPNKNPGVAEIEIAKQRNGPTGIVRLTFRRNCLRFENAAVEAAAGDTIPF